MIYDMILQEGENSFIKIS